MSIPVIDTLKPLGSFPVVDSKDVSHKGESLDDAIGRIPSKTSELQNDSGFIESSGIGFVTPEMYDGVTDDDKFDAMFADRNAVNISINKTYVLERFHASNYCEKMSGSGEIINHTRSSEINNIFEFTKIKKIEGIRFNSDYVSLGSIYVHNIKSTVEINSCEFKGYNVNIKLDDMAEGSQILCKEVDNIIVRNCIFTDNGYQTGTETKKLNRCITHSGEGKSCMVSECTFSNVNQAVVTGTKIKNVIINDNYFYNVTDNVLYHLSDGLAVFRNNKCENCTDECVVAINAVIDSNVIINQSNYIFSLNGDNSYLIQMKDNVIIKNDLQSALNILRFRNSAYRCDNFEFINNNVISQNEAGPYIFNNFNVKRLLFKDNNLHVKINSAGKILNGTCEAATVSGNVLIDNMGTIDNLQLVIPPTNGRIVYENNYVSNNIRPFNDMTNLKSSRIKKLYNKSWYGNDDVPNIIYGSEPPENLTGQIGNNTGTIYINIANTTGEGFMYAWINNAWIMIK